MKSVYVHPARRVVIPNDSIIKGLWKVTEQKYKKMIDCEEPLNVIEMKHHKQHGIIETPVKFTVGMVLLESHPELYDPLNQFDFNVLIACISEWKAGNRYTTPSIIYRGLTGKVCDSDANPSKNQLAAIIKSIKKLMNLTVNIDISDVCSYLKYNHGKPIRIINKILPCKFVEYAVNGQKTTVIEFKSASPFLTAAEVKNNQIVSYDAKLLHVPNQKNTPLNISLKHYILRRVTETISHPKQMAPAITFADVFKKCKITNADTKKKHRVREFIKSVFEHLIKNGVINSYQVNKNNKGYYSISFEFGATEKKEMKAQKPVQKSEPKAAEKKEQVKSDEATLDTLGKKPSKISLAILPWVPWKYCRPILAIPPFNTGNFAPSLFYPQFYSAVTPFVGGYYQFPPL